MFGGAVGLRCRAIRVIRTHGGNVHCSSEGVIVSETNNLGRHLIEVRWEGGFCAYVFPNEIEIVGDECPDELAA